METPPGVAKSCCFRKKRRRAKAIGVDYYAESIADKGLYSLSGNWAHLVSRLHFFQSGVGRD
jgi:hypothetical protein